jgi:hypothetical protein
VDVAKAVGSVLGVDQVLAERSPAEKLEAVQAAQRVAVTVMVGDGINDAPALAAADVGVAIGARGATASSEAADVVLVVDRLDRLVEAIRIARRSRSIALQSVFLGMGLSIAAMGFAAVGLLSPVTGALLQELIDVVVILNALRALRHGRPGKSSEVSMPGFGEQCRAEHRQLWPEIKRIRHVADRLDVLPAQAARVEVEHTYRFLEDKILPHNAAEDATVYPLARLSQPCALFSHAVGRPSVVDAI